MESHIDLDILAQPDDSTCGPTCLHAVYRFYGHERPLSALIDEVPALPGGGTLAVSLACHALRSGFAATIYTYNVSLFDPTWFRKDVDLGSRLRAQRAVKRGALINTATDAYLEFLELGGRLVLEELTPQLLRRPLRHGMPLLTGLSATYLYGSPREYNDAPDDVRGEPVGHFVVLCGYDPASRGVLVADPLGDNPHMGSHNYRVGMHRLIGAILLGIVTHDANVLLIHPDKQRRC